jgi:hypothetical protein
MLFPHQKDTNPFPLGEWLVSRTYSNLMGHLYVGRLWLTNRVLVGVITYMLAIITTIKTLEDIVSQSTRTLKTTSVKEDSTKKYPAKDIAPESLT